MVFRPVRRALTSHAKPNQLSNQNERLHKIKEEAEVYGCLRLQYRTRILPILRILNRFLKIVIRWASNELLIRLSTAIQRNIKSVRTVRTSTTLLY